MTAAWNRLRSCVVGRCWQPESFELVPDPVLRREIQRILQETAEDLEHLVALLERFDVEVSRPHIPQNCEWYRFPPMCPGDYMVSMLGKIYHCLPAGEFMFYQDVLKKFSATHDIIVTENSGICQAMTLLLPDRLIYADPQGIGHNQAKAWWQERMDRPVYRFYDHGHLDGWFCVPTPGLLLSGTDHARPGLLDLARDFLFPGYLIVECDINEGWGRGFRKWCSESRSWAVSDQIWSQELERFINQYLSAWTGNSQETLFEVNSLVIDRHNIVMTHCSDATYRALLDHRVTPHIVPWRHGWLWDAGINCVTFAVHRED